MARLFRCGLAQEAAGRMTNSVSLLLAIGDPLTEILH